MNLSERLREPYKKQLLSAKKTYPSIASVIFKELDEKSFYTDITYGVWMHIKVLTNASNPAEVFEQ